MLYALEHGLRILDAEEIVAAVVVMPETDAAAAPGVSGVKRAVSV